MKNFVTALQYRVFWCTLIFAIFSMHLLAQPQNYVTITTSQVIAPYTPSLSDYAGNPSKIVIGTQLMPGAPGQVIKLLGSLVGDNGVTISSTTAALTILPEIDLPATNPSKVVNGTFIMNLFDLEFVDIQGITAAALQTSGLPPGNYQLCIQAVTAQPNALGQPAGIPISDQVCSAMFSIDSSTGSPESVTVAIQNVQLIQPYFSRLPDFVNNPSKTILVIQSNSTLPSYDFKLMAAIKGDNGVSISTNPSRLNHLELITIPKGTKTTILNASAIQHLFNVEDVLLQGITYNELINGSGLPEGSYELCVTPVAAENIPALQQQAGDPIDNEHCSNSFAITNLEPPVLISPFAGANIPGQQPQNIIFNWSIPAGSKSGLQYVFRMVEVWDSTRNVNDAFLTATDPPFFERIVTNNVIVFGPGDPTLTPGNRYAYCVTAIDPSNMYVFRNGGRSEIGYFTYKSMKPLNLNSVVENEPEEKIDLSQLTGDLNCNCKTPTPSGNVDNSDLKQFSKVKVGKFEMTIVNVTINNGKASGEGKIPIPFLNISQANIRVVFSDITVKRENGTNIMMSGMVKAKRANSIGFSPDVDDPKAGINPFSVDDVKNLEKYFTANTNKLISNIKNASIDLDMPLGLDKEVGGKRMVIALVDFIFTAEQAGFSACMAYTIPDDNTLISLGAKNICFKDASSFCGDLFLFLTNDLKLKSLNLTFKAISESDSGSYVAFDKNGFRKFRVRADYEFSQNVIVKQSDKGPVSATLIADIVKWSDWMATLSIDPFYMADNLDFGFELKGVATYDHSDIRNPEGMPTKAIENKTNFLSNTWNGFLMPELDITLPAVFKNDKTNKPITVKVLNMMIDKLGLTGDVQGSDILNINDGNMDGWAYSLDSVGLRFVNNTYVKGGLNGRILLPITNKNVQSELDYKCTLTHQNNDVNKPLAFNFVIKPKNTIEVPIFIATFDIDKSSSIVVSADNKGFKAVATLNGKMDVSTPDNSGVPKMKLLGMEFQELVLQSKPKYFSVNKFKMSLASPQKEASGFPIGIDSVKLITESEVGLRFFMNFKLADIPAMPKATSVFSITGNPVQFQNGKLVFDFKPKLNLEKIAIEGDMSILKVKGMIQFFNGDNTYGDGFKGAIKAVFPSFGVGIDAALQVGSVNSYQYWFVDAMVDFGKTGIPLFPSTAAYGFGGGAYYNMKSSYDPKTPLLLDGNKSAEVSFGSSPSGVSYVPSPGEMGIKAAMIFGLQQRETFNADVTLEVGFNTNGGIKLFRLTGEGRVISKEKDKAMGKGNVLVQYQFDKQIFDLGVDLTLKIAAVNASGTLALHAEPIGFYLKVGRAWPENSRVNINLGPLNANFYLQAGTYDLDPIPPIPVQIQQILNKSGVDLSFLSEAREGLASDGSGLLFGGGLSFKADGCFLIICGSVYAGVGFDVSLQHYTTDCNGIENPAAQIGIDGWYAVGQAYAGVQGKLYIDLGITKATIFDAGAGAALMAKLPNPEYFAGAVGAYYDIVIASGKFHFEFEYGQKCQPGGNPLSQLKLIADIDPHDGDDNVEINANPQIATNIEIGKYFTLKEDMGDYMRDRYFRFTKGNINVTLNDGKTPVPFELNVTGDSKTLSVFPTEFLKGTTDYTLVVTAALDEFINGQWTTALLGNTPFSETYTIHFTTGKGIKNLNLSDVKYTMPYQGERNFCYANVAQGLISCWKKPSFDIFDIENKDNPKNFEISFLVRFVPVGSSPSSAKSTDVPVSLSGDNFLFDIPTNLAKNTIYAVQFIGQWKFKGKSMMVAKPKPQMGEIMQVSNNQNQLFENKRINERKLSLQPFQQKLFEFWFRTSEFTDYVEKMKTLQVMAGDFKAKGEWDNYARLVSAGDKELSDPTKLQALLAGSYSRHGNLVDAYPASFCVYGAEQYDVYDVEGSTNANVEAGKSYFVEPLLDFKTDCFEQWAKSMYNKLASTIKAGGLNSLSLNQSPLYFTSYDAPVMPALTESEMLTGINTSMPAIPAIKCGSSSQDPMFGQVSFLGLSGLSGNSMSVISKSTGNFMSFGGFQSWGGFNSTPAADPKAQQWHTSKELTLTVSFQYASWMNGGGGNNYNVVSNNQVISSVYGSSLHAGGNQQVSFSTFYQNMGNAFDQIENQQMVFVTDPCFKTNFKGLKRQGAVSSNPSVTISLGQ